MAPSFGRSDNYCNVSHQRHHEAPRTPFQFCKPELPASQFLRESDLNLIFYEFLDVGLPKA